MLYVRRAEERGHAEHGWLDSYHSFSFADYHDPEFMGFSVLRVINEDRIDGGSGFPTHAHSNMEIISYVIEGGLRHKDTMGNEVVIKPGEVQIMSAGTGVKHSEQNDSVHTKAHFLQIWILPEKNGIPPSYEQKSFLDQLSRSNLVLAVSRDGAEGSIRIHQDAKLYLGRFQTGERRELAVSKGRQAWVQVIKGVLDINSVRIGAGDGLAVKDETLLMIQAGDAAEFIVFDLP